jgi:hypothetical protein
LDIIKDVDLYKIEPWDLQGNYKIWTRVILNSLPLYELTCKTVIVQVNIMHETW